MTGTAVLADLVGYSPIAEGLEAALGVWATDALNRQIEDLLRRALAEAGAAPDSFVKSTGDGGLLFFEIPDKALAFAAALQTLGGRRRHPEAHPLATREFRIGAGSGELHLRRVGGRTHDLAGTAIIRAARLEAACPAGGVLIDAATFEGASAGFQWAYAGPERVGVKHGEALIAYRAVPH